MAKPFVVELSLTIRRGLVVNNILTCYFCFLTFV